MSRALMNYSVGIGFCESSKQKFADNHSEDRLVSEQISGTQMLSESIVNAHQL